MIFLIDYYLGILFFLPIIRYKIAPMIFRKTTITNQSILVPDLNLLNSISTSAIIGTMEKITKTKNFQNSI